MKTLAVIVVAVLIIVGAILWIPNLWTHMIARGEGTANWINEKSSLENLARVADLEVQKSRERVQKYHVDIYKSISSVKRLAEEISELKEEKKAEELVLQKAPKILEKCKPGESVVIGSKTYNWEQINQDLLMRIDRCKALDKTTNEKTALLEGLNGQIEEAKNQLVIATNKINELTAKIQEWRIKIATKEREVETAEIVEALKGDPTGPLKGVPIAMKALEDRYLELDAKVAAIRDSAVGTARGNIVDWDKEVGQRNVLEAIKTYFSGDDKTTPKPIVETPNAPSVSVPSDVNN